MENIRYLISRRLEKILHDRKLPQNEVAKRANISVGTLIRVLKGDDFKISTLLALSETLCIRPECLFQEESEKDSHSATAKGVIATATVHDNRLTGNNASLRHEITKQKDLIESLRSNIESLKALVNEKERIIALLNPNFVSPDIPGSKVAKIDD